MVQPRPRMHIERSSEMNTTRILFYLFPVCLVCGCGSISKDQQNVINCVARLGPYPVSRSTVIKDLNLMSLESERTGGRVPGGFMWFLESWNLPTGLEVKAFDSEYVGAMKINGWSIDDILNNPDRTPTSIDLGNIVQHNPERPPQNSFDRITVANARGKVLYDSAVSAEKETKPVDATARSPVVKPESPAPTHHL